MGGQNTIPDMGNVFIIIESTNNLSHNHLRSQPPNQHSLTHTHTIDPPSLRTTRQIEIEWMLNCGATWECKRQGVTCNWHHRNIIVAFCSLLENKKSERKLWNVLIKKMPPTNNDFFFSWKEVLLDLRSGKAWMYFDLRFTFLHEDHGRHMPRISFN